MVFEVPGDGLGGPRGWLWGVPGDAALKQRGAFERCAANVQHAGDAVTTKGMAALRSDRCNQELEADGARKVVVCRPCRPTDVPF